MVELRSAFMCVPLVLVVPGVGGCDADGDRASTSESQAGSETTATGGESGDGDGDGDGDADSAGDPISCDMFDDATPEAVIAATSAAEAPTAPIISDIGVVYEISLPEAAAGFVDLQIAEWSTTQVFYTHADVEYAVSTEAGAEVPQPRGPLEACPDAGLTSQSISFPHWTPATIEFAATGPRLVELIVVQSGE